MMLPGLCSVTFRHLTPEEIIRIAAEAELAGIQWGSDIHVPAGNTALAREVRMRMQDHGLVCGTYGTYYRAGFPESEDFDALLENAALLGARALRIWVGKQGSAETTPEAMLEIRRDLDRILALAAARDMVLVTEFHGGVLTDTAESTAELMKAVAHPALKTAWQPQLRHSIEQHLRSLEILLPWLHELHVFHWLERGEEIERLPLAAGADAWPAYLNLAAGLPLWAWLEFVRDNEPVNLTADAATLRQWLDLQATS